MKVDAFIHRGAPAVHLAVIGDESDEHIVVESQFLEPREHHTDDAVDKFHLQNVGDAVIDQLFGGVDSPVAAVDVDDLRLVGARWKSRCCAARQESG